MTMKNLIELDDFEGIKKAVLNGDNINATDRTGVTPLMRALARKDLAYAKWLLDHGADANQRENDGWTALHFAAQDGFIEGVQLLLSSGAPVDAIDANGNSPLWRASMSCPQDRASSIAKILTKAGADENLKNNHGVSPKEISPDLFT